MHAVHHIIGIVNSRAKKIFFLAFLCLISVWIEYHGNMYACALVKFTNFLCVVPILSWATSLQHPYTDSLTLKMSKSCYKD